MLKDDDGTSYIHSRHLQNCVEEMFRSISLPLRSTTTALYCHTALTVYMVGIF